MKYTVCSVTITPRKKPDSSFEVAFRAVLSEDEAVTSTTLIDRLEQRGLSRTHARQTLFRAQALRDLWRSEHLVLEAGVRIFCWRSFWGSRKYHQQVASIIQGNRRGLHRVLLAVRESVALRSEVEKLLAAPMVLRQGQPYPSFDKEVAALVDLGAVSIEGVGTALERLSDFRIAASQASALAAKAQWAERTIATELTRILANHLRRSNFLTWGSVPKKGVGAEIVAFNNLPFDHVGYSRMGPLLRFTKKSTTPSPTPVVFDVYAKLCREYEVEAFIERMRRAGMNKTSRLPMVGIVAAPEFSKEAWSLAKNEGLMAVNLKTMFGDAALEAMAAVERLIGQAGVSMDAAAEAKDSDVTHLANVLAQASGSPIVADLRSIGFEVMTGLILSQKGWPSIELNGQHLFKKEDDHDINRELDVLGRRNVGGDELYAVECKAEHSAKLLSPDYVRKFFCETVPSMVRSERLKGRAPREVTAEIWTTGQVGQEARDALSNLSLPSYIKVAHLMDAKAVGELVPSSLPACHKLLAAISAPPVEMSPMPRNIP